jgi:hypothetical protein
MKRGRRRRWIVREKKNDTNKDKRWYAAGERRRTDETRRSLSRLVRLFSFKRAFLLDQREYLARDRASFPDRSAVDEEYLSNAYICAG